MEQPQSGDGKYILFGVLFVAVILLIVFMLAFKPKFDVEKQQVNLTNQTVYYSIELRVYDQNQTRLQNVRYFLTNTTNNSNIILHEGYISGNAEIYKKIIPNLTYKFNASKDKYYDGELVFSNISDNETIINLTLDRFADASLSLTHIIGDRYQLMVVADNGSIHRPIVCFRWTELYSISIPTMDFIAIPSDLQSNFDYCYRYKDNLTFGIYQNELTVVKSTVPLENFSLEAVLFDFCANKYGYGCVKEVSNKIYIV